MRNPDRVLTRDMIADHVWDYDFPSVTNVIDVHIRSLRRKLGRPLSRRAIQTVRGAGYRLVAGRDRRALPIRWRLTLWYAALLAAGFLLLGAALYAGLRHRLYDDFEERAQAQSLRWPRSVAVPGGNPVIDVEAAEAWQDDDNFLRLFSTDGALSSTAARPSAASLRPRAGCRGPRRRDHVLRPRTPRVSARHRYAPVRCWTDRGSRAGRDVPLRYRRSARLLADRAGGRCPVVIRRRRRGAISSPDGR